jgi:hypothetical protein
MSHRLGRVRSLVIVTLVAIAALGASAPVAADTYGGPWPSCVIHNVHLTR